VPAAVVASIVGRSDDGTAVRVERLRKLREL
jgi:hypothetical protein